MLNVLAYILIFFLHMFFVLCNLQTRAFEGRMPQGMGVRVPPEQIFLEILNPFITLEYVPEFFGF